MDEERSKKKRPLYVSASGPKSREETPKKGMRPKAHPD